MLSILIEDVFLKKIVKIAKPIAASAAATTNINNEKALVETIPQYWNPSNFEGINKIRVQNSFI